MKIVIVGLIAVVVLLVAWNEYNDGKRVHTELSRDVAQLKALNGL